MTPQLRPLPSIERLHELLSLTESGMVVWRTRPREHFRSLGEYSRWNTRYAGQVFGSRGPNGYGNIDGQKFLVSRIAAYIKSDLTNDQKLL